MAACPCCTSAQTQVVATTPDLPVNPCILETSAQSALRTLRRPIVLRGCSDCGFLWNEKFDPDVVIYDESYEGTQSCSPHFQSYLRQTALSWLERAGPDVGSILEVGCGQGEFLAQLATITDARLVGYDPAFRGVTPDFADVIAQVLPDHALNTFDVVINRMTLEHISDPYSFVRTMAGYVADEGMLVTHVPNAGRMIAQSLYCDLIYEHVNYFTAFSLVQLLQRVGFAQNSVQMSYDDQHLTVFSQRGGAVDTTHAAARVQNLDAFVRTTKEFADTWTEKLTAFRNTGSDIFIWGTGSRATTFLNSLHDPSIVNGAIDINPRRTGTFIQGTDCETRMPETLQFQGPKTIIVMNPIYASEIKATLNDLSVPAELVLCN